MYKKSRNNILGIILGISVGIVLIVYIGFAVYFRNHFYFGSIINGVDYSGKTPVQVEQLIDDNIGTYSLDLIRRDGETEVIRAAEIGLKYVSDGKVEQLKEEQNPFLWPISSFQEKIHDMTVTTSYNKEALQQKINSLECLQEVNNKKPADAYIEFDGNEYSIIEEDQGSLLKKEQFYTLLQEAVETGETSISLEETDCYEKPGITKDYKPLKKAHKLMNKYIQTEIQYDFADRTEILDKTQIQNWIVMDEKYKVTIEEQPVIDYIKTLESVYNTLGKTREFRTTTGKIIKVPSGNYGFMISRGREKDAIVELIKEGAKVEREPEYAQRGYVREANDIGNTYVEINLAKQYMWFYKDGEILVKTKIVTGNVSKNHATPNGVYGITYKERNATLKGEDYTTPVNYWLPFNGDIGIHDAAWRKKFGGKIYKKEGSHGCVNTPYKNAKKIYENIEKGMPVICY